MASGRGDGQGRAGGGVPPRPRLRGRVLLHHVQPHQGGQVLHPALRHHALHDLRQRGHQEDHNGTPGDQERRDHGGRDVHASGGGVPGRVRQRSHDPAERRLLRVPHAGDDDRAAGGLQEGRAAAHGQVGIAAHERAGQLRGAAGQDEPVRDTGGVRGGGGAVRGGAGGPRFGQEAHGLLRSGAGLACQRLGSGGEFAFWRTIGRTDTLDGCGMGGRQKGKAGRIQ
mmetsp:Transcript_27566/g.56476  ORF Transcript_27566/g.56476 Transcript_27566/m.56476 type:complete len:226 (+) Transcript_27566:379-1056(+)